MWLLNEILIHTLKVGVSISGLGDDGVAQHLTILDVLPLKRHTRKCKFTWLGIEFGYCNMLIAVQIPSYLV
jgi:hypothetical protein